MGHAGSKRESLQQAELYLQRTFEGVSATELADHLGCHLATAHRYLREIEDEGRLIKVEYGRYRIDPSESLSNVRLHPSEALTIYLALRRFIRQTSKAPNFMLSAIQKVIPALHQTALVNPLQDAVDILREEFLASAKHTEIWQTLIRGWRESLIVRIDYVKAKETQITTHEIEPYLFEPMPLGDGTYLIAWSRTRNNLRTFKLDRIQRAVLTSQQFEKRIGLDVNALLRHAWGIWYGETPIKVELVFAPQVASRLMESMYLPSEEKQILEDGSLHWTAEVVGIREIWSWVRSWGPEVKVLAPDELRSQIIDDLRQSLAQYE